MLFTGDAKPLICVAILFSCLRRVLLALMHTQRITTIETIIENKSTRMSIQHKNGKLLLLLFDPLPLTTSVTVDR